MLNSYCFIAKITFNYYCDLVEYSVWKDFFHNNFPRTAVMVAFEAKVIQYFKLAEI